MLTVVYLLASFPGLSRFSVLQATESWAGTGNEANASALIFITIHVDPSDV